ncbi:MAG: sulfatase-like hydrolase/transferase [Verrucomicrobiota bacterium]
MKITVMQLLMALLLLAQTVNAERKPNIILIVADDLGYADIGCFGSQLAETPNIDALARDGILFTDFHSNGAVCSPSRAALLTGRYQQRTGITGVVTAAGHRHTGLALEELTIAEVAQSAGYATALFGKWHLGYGPEFNPIHQGFDEFIGFVSGNVDYHIHIDQTGVEDWWKQDQLVPEEGYTTDLITKHGAEFIHRHKDRPFFLYLAHESPHYPFQGRKSAPQYIPGEGKKGRLDKATPEIYKEMIEVMDEGIGLIRQAVEAAGLADNTLIVFTSDNGPVGQGSAGVLRGTKGSHYEGGHRVPTLAWWPGAIQPGRVSDETLMGADLLPTVVALTGARLPDSLEIDGVNLVPHLVEATSLPSRDVFWGIKRNLIVRRGDYKLITDRNFKNTELYNLKEDIGEKNNVATQYPELVRDLLEVVRNWHKTINAGVKNRS